MNKQPVKHGRTQFYIEGEGFTQSTMPSPRLRAMVPAAVAAMEAAPPLEEEERAFRFCRLFPDLEKFQPDDAGLIALGQALADPFMPGSGDSEIPAGFTYLGQFVDHDITFDRTAGLPSGSLNPEEIESGRSPALELDSVYGRGPTDSPELYEPDGLHLKIGITTGRPDFGVTATFPNDLPRRPADHPQDPKRAIIGDPRNDENLIVAQTHLVFLKFHNKVVDHLRTSGTEVGSLFAEARKTVIQHYQSIVLHDFVSRLVAPTVFNDVLTNGRKIYFAKGKYLCMPVEFSVAAYRLGHSMIRNAYQWNRVFSSDGSAGFVPQLTLFFEFSKNANVSDLGGHPTLPSDWIADWRRMYDFSEQPAGVRHPQLNFTRQIDTKLAAGLSNLPEFANAEQEHLKFLAVRNLLRGRLVGLPTGQAVANKLGVPALTPTEVASGPQSAVVLAQGFDKKTPLWFYVLKEAELKQGGLHLGEVGSRLVAETFHGLVDGSDYSIFKDANWKPTLPAQNPDRFTMNDLLLFVNDLNPLGD
jgi:hypothetical protein